MKPLPVATPRCQDCRYFQNDPAVLERRIPGLRVMGSGYSAVRQDDGLCELQGRYLSSSRACPGFTPRTGG